MSLNIFKPHHNHDIRSKEFRANLIHNIKIDAKVNENMIFLLTLSSLDYVDVTHLHCMRFEAQVCGIATTAKGVLKERETNAKDEMKESQESRPLSVTQNTPSL